MSGRTRLRTRSVERCVDDVRSPVFSVLGPQAAAEFAKTHLPQALRQQLLAYEREKDKDKDKEKDKDKDKEKEKEEKERGGGASYASILEQQILALDREMLVRLSASYNEAGADVAVAGGNVCTGTRVRVCV